jgi:predicted house-cleaning noncanonical NTP pyrophosphatase (MazG superfamily)
MKKIFNKLVRDKMIDIYKHDVANEVSASDFAVRYLSPEETLEKLKDKLLEEVQELFEVYEFEDTSKLKEESADIIEVIDEILKRNHSSLDEVLALREAKREHRGGFETGLFLESIDYFDEHV